MRSTYRVAAVAAVLCAAAYIILVKLVSSAHALGYPVPQPKPPCGTGDYFDGAAIHRNVAADPGTKRYIATADFVLVQTVGMPIETAKGWIVLPVVQQHTYDDDGCYVLNMFMGDAALPWLDLLTDQEDS